MIKEIPRTSQRSRQPRFAPLLASASLCHQPYIRFTGTVLVTCTSTSTCCTAVCTNASLVHSPAKAETRKVKVVRSLLLLTATIRWPKRERKTDGALSRVLAYNPFGLSPRVESTINRASTSCVHLIHSPRILIRIARWTSPPASCFWHARRQVSSPLRSPPAVQHPLQ